MQTFLPHADFVTSVSCLDNMRLGKQRVEAFQIITALLRGNGAWYNHPATKMWKDNIQALMYYHDLCIIEWESRGFNNAMKKYEPEVESIIYPDWVGNEDFHRAHQSNLLRKAEESKNKYHELLKENQVGRALVHKRVYDWYLQISTKHRWTHQKDLPYIWPV